MADHLSRLRTEDIQTETIRETFPDEQLYVLHSCTRPWYADLVNYLVTKEFPPGLSTSQKDKLRADAKYYFWDTPYLWKFCVDQVVRRCVPHNMNFIPFSPFVILILVVDLEQKERPIRYLKLVFIGLLFLRMHIIFANHVKNAKKQVISLTRIKCL